MRLICIDAVKVTGNKDIFKEEKISGEVEFVPNPDGSGLLMLPIGMFIKENRLARKRRMMETIPLSKWDIRKRSILSLNRKECQRLLKPGGQTEFIVKRKGWGKIWNHKFKIIATDCKQKVTLWR